MLAITYSSILLQIVSSNNLSYLTLTFSVAILSLTRYWDLKSVSRKWATECVFYHSFARMHLSYSSSRLCTALQRPRTRIRLAQLQSFRTKMIVYSYFLVGSSVTLNRFTPIQAPNRKRISTTRWCNSNNNKQNTGSLRTTRKKFNQMLPPTITWVSNRQHQRSWGQKTTAWAKAVALEWLTLNQFLRHSIPL